MAANPPYTLLTGFLVVCFDHDTRSRSQFVSGSLHQNTEINEAINNLFDNVLQALPTHLDEVEPTLSKRKIHEVLPPHPNEEEEEQDHHPPPPRQDATVSQHETLERSPSLGVPTKPTQIPNEE